MKRKEFLKKLREESPEQLKKRLNELRLELMKEKGFVASGRPVKDTSKIRNLKRNIARILTIIGGRTKK
ncbi:MAG: 50S ribosomal protein L29 [Candidatus Aenigmarchaeota archaeon]|nr:50S ribosomal protein L29 [Candidatus Aenigmarchaeota archaeon]MDW8160227.1 50S ribosomal protein L29 [Candidatus Aenigmarchaeota archaeon]